MSEPQEEYITDADKLAEAGYVEEAVKMLGAGYNEQPAAIIDPPRTVKALQEKGLVEYQVWGWVKTSANFIYHIKKLKGAKLSVWNVVALSIDESGKCKLSAPEIAHLTGYSVSEVRETLAELDEMGYLSITRSTGKRSVYEPEFAARSSNNPTVAPKSDPSRKATPPVGKVERADDPSSPSIENLTPSIKRVKRVNVDSNIKGIEAAMFQGRAVTEEDLPAFDNREKIAIAAFEQALGLPANWNWYPAKTTEEKTWKDFRLYILKAFEHDNDCFSKYNTWRNIPYQKDTMSNLGIKRSPENFPTSWVAFLASDMYSKNKSSQQPIKTDSSGAPITY